MPAQAKNQKNVPIEDLPYFIAATTAGLRQQLRGVGIPAGGLKYDLYLRLRANGLRIYNDTRGSPEPEDSDDSDSDEDEDEGGDEGGPGDGESSSSSSSRDDDLGVPPSGGRSGKKRKRENGEASVQEDVPEPETLRPTSLADMPVELAITIIRNLDARGVFNLVAASPQQYLDGNVNAFVLEAEGRRNAASGRNGVSLLEWVMTRAANEVDFRTNYRDLIRCVVDAYLLTYPSNSPQDRSGEDRVEEIMVYLRQVGANPVLMSAVRSGEAELVQLLIILGEDVNQRENNVAPLEQATILVSSILSKMNRLLIVFSLLAGGADTTSTRADRHGVPEAAEHRLSHVCDQLLVKDRPSRWPVIQNPRGLTIRQFLADERSPFMDRATLALILIITRDRRYPGFEGYDPEDPDCGPGSGGPLF